MSIMLVILLVVTLLCLIFILCVGTFLHSGRLRAHMFTVISFRETPEYHDSFGKCIYCGSTGGEGGLTKEHIVPYALDGSIVLRGASCAKCQKETKEIEKLNFQGQHSNFGVFLVHDNYHYRRKKKKPRPTHLPITVRASTHLAWRM